MLSKYTFGSAGILLDCASVIALSGLSIRFRSESILIIGAAVI